MISQKRIESWKFFGLKEYAGIHNIYLEILFSLGIFLFFIFKDVFKQKDFILSIFLIYFLVIGSFDHSILTGKTYLASITLLIFFIFTKKLINR